MTPAARYASAISVLDDVLSGASAEKCLTSWARANRYAGSKDRAAVRDHVFDVLRRKRSLAARGGDESGRALVLGLLRHQGIDPMDVFGAGGYAPVALTEAEIAAGVLPTGPAETHDLPDWLWPVWAKDLGESAIAAAAALQDRGPVTLRVNLRRGSREAATAILAEDGIVVEASQDVKTALQVVENERRVHLSRAYLEGFVDLQDLASQQAVLSLNIPNGARVLDYCAGGGGKALALADLFACQVTAHDISAARMKDIPVRAERAVVSIEVLNSAALDQGAGYDVVFADAPCSGSGTWRRAPEAKWSFTPDKLFEYNVLQLEVIENAARFVGAAGQIVYATCSVLSAENSGVLLHFTGKNPDWEILSETTRLPDAAGDGFFHSVLQCRARNL